MQERNPSQPPSSALPRWGAEQRDAKARTILRVMERFGPASLRATRWLDIGCGSGGIAAAIAPHVGNMVGVDPEPWPQWREYSNRETNLEFIELPVERLGLADGSFDVVICNQVYEHVPDPQLLIRQIHRLLKPGGFCYFAGPNLLFPIEPHVFWPFIHWVPRSIAVRLMRMLGARSAVDANSASYWILRRWFSGFKITNALPAMLAEPDFFEIGSYWARQFSWLPRWMTGSITWISPTFIFVLRKEADDLSTLQDVRAFGTKTGR